MMRDKKYERDDKHCLRDVYIEDQALKLSQYNESLANRNSTSMKFDWMQLLGDPAKSGTNDKSRSLREIDSKDNATRLNSDRKHYKFSGLGGFERKLVDENPGPGLALSSRGLGDPAKSITDDKSHSSKEIDSDDCYGVNATRLNSARKNFRESEYSGLGGFERKLVDENPKPGLALSSRSSDESIVYKSLARESCKEANYSVRYSRGDTYCMEQPGAQPTSFGTESLALLDKEFPGSLRSNSRVSFGGDRCRAEMINSTIVHDARDVKMCGKSNVTRAYPLADNILVEEEHKNDTYNEGSRIKRGNMFQESDDFHVDDSVPDDYSHSYFDCTVDKIDECYEELSTESMVWYDDYYLQGNKILDNSDMNMSHTQKRDNEVVDRTRAYGMYEREQYVNQRSPLAGDDHGCERSEMSPQSEYDLNVHYGHRSRRLEEDHGHERSETLPFKENDQYLNEIVGLPQRLIESELNLIDESTLMLKRKHDMADISTNIYTGNTIPGNNERGVKNYYQGGAFVQLSTEDGEGFNLSKKLRSSHSPFRQSERASYETTPRSVTEHNSAVKDIMKRLGPRHQDINASSSSLYVNMPEASVRKRLGPVEKSKPSVKQRLGPGPKLNQTEFSRMKTQNSKKLCQRACHDDNNHVQIEQPYVADVISTNYEPHENSEEFKQLVHSAYFRFVKQLNENSSQRRRILEQGKAGRLKCIVCGSKSKEFVDTKSLVVHTFYSHKVGFRALHLGFHRALCMLMGWKNKTAGGHKWLGMGFEERIKVCRGRPANHSIMAVIFNSTLSGLEAAERLHNFYSKTKHGKSDFENIRSCSSSCTGEASKASEKKAEHVLYGYLGIAEDLDKLEFETKKRCLVKSKKEIQRIAMQP